MDPRLRVAVDSSVAWYDALCTLHGVACTLEDGLWVSASAPPPLHSAAKTVEPGVDAARVARAARDRGGVADSFADLDLRAHGFELLFAARWIYRGRQERHRGGLAPGWSAVRSAEMLSAWTAQHDTAGVLLPAILERSSFLVLAREADGNAPTAGAVLHLGTGAAAVTNVWSTGGDVWDDLVHNATATWPGRALVGYESGADLDAALAAGFEDVGPQLVWV